MRSGGLVNPVHSLPGKRVNIRAASGRYFPQFCSDSEVTREYPENGNSLRIILTVGNRLGRSSRVEVLLQGFVDEVAHLLAFPIGESA